MRAPRGVGLLATNCRGRELVRHSDIRRDRAGGGQAEQARGHLLARHAAQRAHWVGAGRWVGVDAALLERVQDDPIVEARVAARAAHGALARWLHPPVPEVPGEEGNGALVAEWASRRFPLALVIRCPTGRLPLAAGSAAILAFRFGTARPRLGGRQATRRLAARATRTHVLPPVRLQLPSVPPAHGVLSQCHARGVRLRAARPARPGLCAAHRGGGIAHFWRRCRSGQGPGLCAAHRGGEIAHFWRRCRSGQGLHSSAPARPATRGAGEGADRPH